MSNNFDEVWNEVLQFGIDRSDLNALGEDFLSRQVEQHRGYDCTLIKSSNKKNKFPYASLLADKLLLFACLMGKQHVNSEWYNPESTYIDTDEKLKLLRVMGPTKYLWYDQNLWRAYARRTEAHSRFRKIGLSGGELSYTGILRELGSDSEVVERWGRKIVYEKDISSRVFGMRKFKKKR